MGMTPAIGEKESKSRLLEKKSEDGCTHLAQWPGIAGFWSTFWLVSALTYLDHLISLDKADSPLLHIA
jgi:hypothetical protein